MKIKGYRRLRRAGPRGGKPASGCTGVGNARPLNRYAADYRDDATHRCLARPHRTAPAPTRVRPDSADMRHRARPGDLATAVTADFALAGSGGSTPHLPNARFRHAPVLAAAAAAEIQDVVRARDDGDVFGSLTGLARRDRQTMCAAVAHHQVAILSNFSRVLLTHGTPMAGQWDSSKRLSRLQACGRSGELEAETVDEAQAPAGRAAP
jgi:hypothetical protein